MKKHSKIGKRKGLPTYRTPSQFRDRILQVVRDIPRGKVLSYKEVAQKAGKPKAYRAVGNILSKNKDGSIPCHRVIKSDGNLGGYNRGKRKKIDILKKEGAIK